MTAARRVAWTRIQLSVAVALSALLWAGAIMCVMLAAQLLADTWAHGWTRTSVNGNWNGYVSGAVALLAGCLVTWRARFVLSSRRVALWIEERTPLLQYALVTASDPLASGDTGVLEALVERSGTEKFVRPALIVPVVRGIVALALALGAYTGARMLASGGTRMAVHEALGRIGVDTPLPNRLLELSVTVTAPAYAGGTVRMIRDPSGVTALAGSRVTIRGRGVASGVAARLAGREVAVSGEGNWEAAVTMPSVATTVSLSDRNFERVLAMIPVADQPPAVALTQPSRDTVWRHVPGGALTFVARASDDIGLAAGHLEYTVTTGSGEIFKSRTSAFGAARLGRAKVAELRATLALAPLALTEGAILSVRAVVSDNNTLTGPGTSTSDTRTFRVARADEYDSLAVDAAPPPPVERSLLTERMLIVAAESLLKKRPALDQKEFKSSAGRIGLDQADLRKKVYNILYEQDEAGGGHGVEGDDEELDPQLVLNRDLKQAYDAMWDAERSLSVGEINAALPFMTTALHALDRARLANRLYLRGKSARVVVNVEKVRLTAKEKGVGSVVARTRPRADSASLRLDRSLGAALSMVRSNPSGFVDALIRLRAESVPVNASFAGALGDAVDAYRAGTDMTAALVRARRALHGVPRAGDPGLQWSGSWDGPR